MIKEILEIITIVHNMTFTLVIAMIFGGFILSMFIDFKQETEDKYIKVMKYSFIISVFTFILDMVLQSAL